MKICFVNPTRLQREIYVIAHRLAERGHTVTVLQPSGAIQKYPAWKNVGVLPIPCHYVPEARYALPALIHEYRLLAYFVRAQQYDLVHVQDYQYLTALPPVWVRKQYGTPITLVNNALVGVDWHYGKWPFDQVAAVYTHTLGRFLHHAYNRIIFLTRYLEQQTRRCFGPTLPPSEVIPFGVDFSCFYRVEQATKRQELGIAPYEKVILFVGRFVGWKRVELVIELTRQLRTKGLPVRAIIIGGGKWGNRATEERYHALARPLGSAVVFTGPKQQDELRDYLSMADVLVLPSLSETFGNVLLEAGACKLACVASEVGGVPEVIAHGETGYLFPPHDVATLVSCVEELLRNTQQAQKMGEQAYQRVKALFDWERIVDRYERLFDEVIEEA
jgi:glycosyltransferase involved in cell wall biosynthesis